MFMLNLFQYQHLLLLINDYIPPLKGVGGMIIRDVEKAEFDFINRSGATALSDVHWLRDPFQPLIP